MNLAEALRSSLRAHLSAISIESLIQRHVKTPLALVRDTSPSAREEIAERLTASARLFSASDPQTLRAQLRLALALEEPSPSQQGAKASAQQSQSQLIQIRSEIDVSVARNEARRMASELGVTGALPVMVATAVSELARNIILYASHGTISIETAHEPDARVIRVFSRDEGPGIGPAQLESMFAGTYRSRSGLGKGLAAVKRVAHEFNIDTAPGKGTAIRAVFRGTP